MLVVNKSVGETPLECLERTRREKWIDVNVPMTYAGRLDPLASGKLLLLIGEECKEKEKYLGLDKEYEIEVLFGVGTDTGDALGLITQVDRQTHAMTYSEGLVSKGYPWTKFCGKFTQVYPAYSSKTVCPRSDLGQVQDKISERFHLGKKRHLHDLARSGELPDEMPTKEVEIYSIEELARKGMDKGRNRAKKQLDFIGGNDLAERAIENVSKVNGDFRQKEIIEGWKKFESEHGAENFLVIKLRVSCGSGTYMRSLAERIGREAGTATFALSIERTKIGEF
jgi:tRNA pseudouridine55 synthase